MWHFLHKGAIIIHGSHGQGPTSHCSHHPIVRAKVKPKPSFRSLLSQSVHNQASPKTGGQADRQTHSLSLTLLPQLSGEGWRAAGWAGSRTTLQSQAAGWKAQNPGRAEVHRSPAQATAWHLRTFLPFGTFSGRGLPFLLTSFLDNSPQSTSGMRTIPCFTQGTLGAWGQCFWFPNNLRPRRIHALFQGIAGSQPVAARLSGQSPRAGCPGDKGSSASPR